MHHGVVAGHGERAAVERDAVVPEAELARREDREEREGSEGRGGERGLRPAPGPEQRGRPPGDHDEQADQRNVGVPVRHRLVADLHQPDHRDEGSQVPVPSHGEPRHPAARQERERGQQGNPERRGADREGGPRARMRIQDAEPGGPEHLARVARVGHEGVADPPEERDRLERRHGFVPALHDERHGAGSGGEREQGELLEEQAERVPPALEAPEGPPVEEQEDERKGDDHRLREEPHGEGQRGRGGSGAARGARRSGRRRSGPAGRKAC